MIASEAFHAVPLNKSYGRFPKNNQFESFTLDAEKDLAEMLTDKKFLYSNSTKTVPEKPEKLEHVITSYSIHYTKLYDIIFHQSMVLQIGNTGE